MREHLYCGKRKDNGEWVEGDLVHSKTTSRGIITEIYTLDMRYEVIPETVGEWTGLTDKNVKKIFEGDIVEYLPDHARFIIAWNDMNACFALTVQTSGSIHYEYNEYTMDDTHEFEVVGNIHDNPELLAEV